LNSKLHAVCDGYGRPLIMLLSEGQMSDYKGAALMLPALPKAEELLGDKGYDADWFRQALAERGITACIPSKSNRKKPIEHDRTLYRQRHKSRICSADSRIGDVFIPATTDALTHSCQPYASPPSSSSGYDQ
jgi:transposase